MNKIWFAASSLLLKHEFNTPHSDLNSNRVHSKLQFVSCTIENNSLKYVLLKDLLSSVGAISCTFL